MSSLSADVSVVPKENNAYLLNPGKGWIIYTDFASASTAAWAKASVGYARYMWKDIHTNDNQIIGSKYSYQPLGEWNGEDADTFLKDAGPLVDEWQNKMGYWFKLVSATYPGDLGNGMTGTLSFRMRNDGVAPIYIKGSRGVVKVALMDQTTNVLGTVTLKGVNPFDWKPGETVAQSAEFAFPQNAKGTKLALGVFTKESLANPDIKLGIDHGTARNWYVLSDMPRGVH